MTSRRAFTLIEVLLAIGLVLALAAGMLSYIWGLLGSRDRIVTATEQQMAAAAMFEQLEADLATTFTVDGAGEPGVVGSSTGLLVRARGVATAAGGNDFGDVQGCEVKFDSGTLSARRLGKNEEGFEVLAASVAGARFRYFDGTEWKESFNSGSTGSLPAAVEVALWFGEASSEDGPPTRAPDRVRVLVIPDGPVASWKSHL